MRKLQWAGILLGTLLVVALGIAGILDLTCASRPMPPKPPTTLEPLRIGVLGDSQKGLANLRNITRAVLAEKVGLLMQTGDLVSNNDDGHYRLAARYLQAGGSAMPFVSPGNHDVKGGRERFAAWCGPDERAFTLANVAFVLIDNAHGNPPPDPQHVEERIYAAGPHRKVIVAMHQPPLDIEGKPKPEYAKFLAWLENSKVDYLLCGHVHGYIKKQVGQTTVIINGVGGDYDKWQLGQKVYATILDLNGDTLTDRRIEIEPAHEVWENIEHLAVGHVAEAYRRLPLLCWGATLLLAGGVGWGWIRLLRKPKNIETA